MKKSEVFCVTKINITWNFKTIRSKLILGFILAGLGTACADMTANAASLSGPETELVQEVPPGPEEISPDTYSAQPSSVSSNETQPVVPVPAPPSETPGPDPGAEILPVPSSPGTETIPETDSSQDQPSEPPQTDVPSDNELTPVVSELPADPSATLPDGSLLPWTDVLNVTVSGNVVPVPDPEQEEPPADASVSMNSISMNSVSMNAVLFSSKTPLEEECDRLGLVLEGLKIIGVTDSFAGGMLAIPEGVEIIGQQAFLDKLSLTGVVFPSSLLRIEDGAFSGCSNITILNFSKCASLQYMGYRAFKDCGRPGSIEIIISETLLDKMKGDYDSFADSMGDLNYDAQRTITIVVDRALTFEEAISLWNQKAAYLNVTYIRNLKAAIRRVIAAGVTYETTAGEYANAMKDAFESFKDKDYINATGQTLWDACTTDVSAVDTAYGSFESLSAFLHNVTRTVDYGTYIRWPSYDLLIYDVIDNLADYFINVLAAPDVLNALPKSYSDLEINVTSPPVT